MAETEVGTQRRSPKPHHSPGLLLQRKANTELLHLWWRIGRTILERQVEQGGGTKVLSRLDSDQAQEITKDPYALQFLAVDRDVSERELE